MSLSLELMGSGALEKRKTAQELLKCNDRTAEYGLVLSPEQAAALAEYRGEALRSSGRLELSGSVLSKLILAFRDSPYLTPREYPQQLSELLDIFYFYKNETLDELSDDELLEYLKKSFDGACQGSFELLSGRALEDLLDSLDGNCTIGEEMGEENDEY